MLLRMVGVHYDSPEGRAILANVMYADVSVTDACNFECEHCCGGYSKENSSYLSLPDFRTILSLMRDLENIKIYGGEPFLHQNIEEIIKESSSKARKTAVITNGFLLPETVDELVEYFMTQPPNVMFVMSISPWHKQRYSENGRNIVTKARNVFTASQKSSITVYFSLTYIQWADVEEYDRFIKYKQGFGIPFRRILENPLESVGRAEAIPNAIDPILIPKREKAYITSEGLVFNNKNHSYVSDNKVK